MGFEWRNIEETVNWVVFQMMVGNGEEDGFIAKTVKDFSNGSEEGLEKEWEKMLTSVIASIRTYRKEGFEKLKQNLEELSQDALNIQTDPVGNLRADYHLEQKLQGIKENRKLLLRIEQAILRAEKVAKPNWLKRMVNEDV